MTMPTLRSCARLRSVQRAESCVILLLVSLVSLAYVPSAGAQANVQGQWQTLPNLMPINPVHSALLHNGKVLIVSGSGNVAGNTNYQAGVFDPATGTVTTQPVGWDMFCNGMVVLQDGRAFVDGGTLQYDPFFGQSRSSIYDPATGKFTDVQNMAHGRWYPTVTNLPDGTLMTFSGLDESSTTNSTVEIYTIGSGWSTQYGSPFTPPLYPRMSLLPNGKIFYSGSTTSSRYFDPVAHTWSGVVANTNFSGTRTYGTSVLLPLTPANNYKPVVMIMGGGNPSTNTTELIDLSAASPQWVYGPNMSQPRIEMNATILPNGKVIALGGSLNDEDTKTPSLNADMYDPATNMFTSAGQNAFARLYHSNSLLLPDATVLFIGGNPQRGTYEQHMEIYSPPYLFNPNGSLATRPTITGVPATGIGYGANFQVQTPDAASIATVVLMRPGAPTHAFDMEQRMVGMNFTAGSGVLNVTAPPNSNIAPPGYYLLFLLNTAGVPSIAQFVQITPTPADIPPTGTITSPSTDMTITAGQSVFFAGSGTDPDGTITAYSWTFPGGSPTTSALATPGNVIYSTAGAYTATLTVTDNANLTDPNPPTRKITVNPVGGLATPTLVQRTSKDAGIVASSSLAFPANNTAGNFIAVVIRAGTAGQVLSVGDSRGNTYHQAVQFNQTLDGPRGETLAIYYAENIFGGANTVTVSESISNNTLRFAILEYSGVATANSLDVTAAAQGSGTTLSSGNATTTVNGDLILGLVATADGLNFTAGSGFIIEASVPVSPSKLIAEDAIQSATGAVAVTATLSTSDNGGALLAAFKGAAVSTGPPPASITATAGTPQSATVNTAFGTQLQATVKDASSNPVNGATVTFAAPGSGASGTFSGGVNTATTNAQGVATAPVFTANGMAGGPYTVTAAVSGVSTMANFSLTNTAGAPASITATAGTPQSAAINTAFTTQLQATVKDGFGNPVGGATVTFNAPASGASGTFAGGVNTAMTNAQGVATAPVFTANGTAGGPYTVTASVSGVSTPANFSLTNLSGAPANITATAGTPQSATVNTAFTTQLQATVKDASSNPVGGATVTFTAPASGASGTFAGGVNTAITNAQGVATASVFTANGTAGGPYIVTASVSGISANFSLTNTAGAPASITATAGTPQSATVNTAFATQMQATVKDTFGNPVNGATVTFTAPASGASGTFAGGVNTAMTNPQGVATAPVFTANLTAGGYTVTASVSGISANFSLTNTAGAPANITATSGTPQSAFVNTAFGTQLQATVKDAFGNPVNGATVTFTAPASGASGTFAGGVNTVITNAQGVATAPVFTANGTVGGPYTVTAAVSGVSTPANFSLTNTAGAPAPITLMQHTSKDAGIVASSSLAFPANNTAGNFIAVVIRAGTAGQVLSVGDSRGNTYHQAVQFNQTLDGPRGETLAIYYAENIGGGANTVTVSESISNNTLRFAILEYSGVATANSLDATAAAQGSGTTLSSGNATTTVNGDLILGLVATADGLNFTAGSGFTIEERVPAAPNSKLIAEDAIQAAAGPVTVTATLSTSDNGGALLAAFKHQ